MNTSFARAAMATALATGASVSAFAATPAELEAQVAAMQAELAQLKAEQASADWANQRRADEVRALVREVMADENARTAGSMSTLAAGHNGKNFILSNDDGSFSMKISGQAQFRYIYNDNQSSTPGDSDAGFQARRMKLGFSGNAGDFGYNFKIQHSRTTGTVDTDSYEINYKLGNGAKIKAGLFKLPFARQELVSASRMVAAERGQTVEHFTLNKSEGIGIDWQGDSVALSGAFSDGGNSDTQDFNDSAVKYAFTGRVDTKLAGNWSQAKDEIAWSGEETGIFIGGAVHYQEQDNEDAQTLAYTVDALVETGNFGITAAYFGAEEDGDAASAANQSGFYAQVAYDIDDKWVPFIRYNWLDVDTTGFDDTQSVALGVNYMFDKHNAKLTADVVYVFDGTGDGGATGLNGLNNGAYSDSLGLMNADDEDQLALRLQMQLLF